MPSTLELCEQYYGTKDIYQLMGISKNAIEKDIKKSYYKLSLQVHPDRVPEQKKAEATEKFKVLSRIHAILSDKDKKALYDDKGIIDDDDDNNMSKWLEMWKMFFKPISIEDIDNYQREYIDSDLEKSDIKKAYLNGKGCINYMMNSVPFMSVEAEPRIQELVKGWIAAGEVPDFKQFTDEPKAKRNRRHKKYAKESEEAKSIKADHKDFSQIIAERRSQNENFLDKLMEKYSGGVDDSEEFDFEKVLNKSKNKNKTSAKKTRATTKNSENKVRNGRVTKSKRST